MLRSLFMAGIYFSFLCLGMAAPFVFTLGYCWVDTFRPQSVAYMVLNQVPVALIMGTAAVLSYFLMDRRSPPRMTLITVLTVMMAFWVTTTLLWAEVPASAWAKWNWAFKTIVFSAFIPLVIRSRVQIEAFMQTLLFSLGANLIPFGLKVMLSGGGYGRSLGLGGEGNAGLGEGATLAAVAVASIPVSLFLRKHSVLLPKVPMMREIYILLAVTAILTTIGTYERTGLVGLAVLAVYAFVHSRRKLLLAVGMAVVAALIVYKTSAAWNARIATIDSPVEDVSALTRLLVWQWTFYYSLSHPFGGGFGASAIDHIIYPNGDEGFGRAFHSIYFEVLGEQGWVGLAMFLGMAVASFLVLRRTRIGARKVEGLAWCADLAATLQISLVVLMACGAFIGIAFQPWLYYLFALSVSVSQYYRRATEPEPVQSYLRSVGRSPALAAGVNIAGPDRPLQADRSATSAGRNSNLRTAWRPGTSRQ